MLTKEKVLDIQQDINCAIQEVAEKHGIQINMGNCRYNKNNATMSLKIATVSNNGNVNTKERENFKNFAIAYGLCPDFLDHEFDHNGNQYKIIGLNTRAHKFPVIVREISTGKNYKIKPDTLLRYLSGKYLVV